MEDIPPSPGTQLVIAVGVEGAGALDTHHVLLNQSLGHLGSLPHFCYLLTYPGFVI